MSKLEVRATLYESLNYYAARAEKALADGNIEAHVKWALKYHDMKKLIEG